MKLKKMNESSKLFFSAILLVGATSAIGANEENSSLVAIEGGYSYLSSEVTDRASTPNSYDQEKAQLGNIALKLGAESKNYRVFLNGRYYFANAEYDALVTYGVDVQYKFDFSSSFDIFIGAGAGIAEAKFQISGEPFSRTISDPYYSGDLGVNFHLSESVDLEIAGRYISLEALNSKSDVDYTFNDIITGYASIIYKFNIE